MLEVINGFLLMYFLVLCIISILTPFIVKPIAACFSKPTSKERIIWTEILKLKAEQRGVSMKDEFAAYSKLQRKILKLEVSLKENSQTRVNKSLAIKGSVQLVMQVVMGVLTLFSVIWFRHEPIVTMKANLFPLSSMLSYPSGTPNAISSHVWVLISNLSLRALLKPVLA